MSSVSTSQTDLDLLDRFRTSNDREAFGELVRRYGPIVFGVCRRVLGNDHASDDAFQQTFMNLARSAHGIRKPEALVGWLHATARRAALSIAGRKGPKTTPTDDVAARGRDPLEEITARELVTAVDEELAALPEEYRSAILLCGIEGLTVNEAAQRLGTSHGSLRGWLQRGRELLKTRLEKRGLAVPAALGAVFGLPTPVSAATTAAAIEAAVAAPAAKPTVWAALFTGVVPKLFLVGATAAAIFAACVIYSGKDGPPKPQLPPLQVARWELTTDTPLPKGAIARIGDGRHTLALGSKQIRFAGGGSKLVAVGSTDFLAWDVTTGEQLHRTPIDDAPGDVSPDGRWFAQKGNVYDALTGKLVWQAFRDREPDTVLFIPPDRVVMTFRSGSGSEVMVRRLDIEARAFTEATFAGSAALPLGNGGLMAVWGAPADGNVPVDDMRVGEIRVHSFHTPEGKSSRLIGLTGFRGVPLTVTTEPDNSRIYAVTSDGRLSRWQASMSDPIYSVPVAIPGANVTKGLPNGGTVRCIDVGRVPPLAVSPDGDKVVWRGWQGTNPTDYLCYSISRRQILWDVKAPTSTPASFLFDEKAGRLFVNNQGIEVRNLNTGELLSPPVSDYADRGPTHFTRTTALSPDGRLVAFSSNNIGLYEVAKLLDPKATPTDAPETHWRNDSLGQVGFVPGSNKLVWTAGPKFTVYDVEAKKTLAAVDTIGETVVPDYPGEAKWVGFARWNRKWAEYTWDGGRLAKTERAAQALQRADRESELAGIVYPHDGRLFTGDIEAGEKPRAFATCWDAATGGKKWVYVIPPDPDFTPTGWSTTNGVTAYGEYQPIRFLALPDNKRLFVLTNTRGILLDIDTGRELKVVSSGSTKPKNIEFDNVVLSNDGLLLAVTVLNADQRGEVRFYRTDTLAQAAMPIVLGHLWSHSKPGPNIFLALSPDAKLVAVAANTENGLQVVDVATGARKYQLPLVNYCRGLAFSADGRRLVAKEANQKTALVWELERFAVK
ncbi:sigma-70 family RNA polymerase sigma factor [Fimbriiglobus ruber]|uniref:Transcriptional control protein n=1 Tax=Fimbriiglobus ruber TaxID=1908690 RepID=A0A225E4M7_9BACT|nr:sigma-70 family RNA polymerase sigma factor [Fimbriiglobus ruber]OWK45758.1 transcriptional control protein [Fimbriiglobus ruber]